jgi:hypothetical protein
MAAASLFVRFLEALGDTYLMTPRMPAALAA